MVLLIEGIEVLDGRPIPVASEVLSRRRPAFDTPPPVRNRLSAMVRRCGTWLVVLALVVATGGHWAVLQLCAWTGMLVI